MVEKFTRFIERAVSDEDTALSLIGKAMLLGLFMFMIDFMIAVIIVLLKR